MGILSSKTWKVPVRWLIFDKNSLCGFTWAYSFSIAARCLLKDLWGHRKTHELTWFNMHSSPSVWLDFKQIVYLISSSSSVSWCCLVCNLLSCSENTSFTCWLSFTCTHTHICKVTAQICYWTLLLTVYLLKLCTSQFLNTCRPSLAESFQIFNIDFREPIVIPSSSEMDVSSQL